MPPLGFLGGSLVAIALALWYSTSCAINEQEKLCREMREEERNNFPLVRY